MTDHHGDEVKAVQGTDTDTDNYFGGHGAADGAGHGHAVVDEDGELHYYRDSDPDGGRGEVLYDDRTGIAELEPVEGGWAQIDHDDDEMMMMMTTTTTKDR